MDYTIAPMTIADYDDAVTLWQCTDGVGLHLADADSRDGIARFLQRNPGMSFAARVGEKLAGVVLCGHEGRRGYLHHLAVDRDYRQQGIGSALVERCLAALRGEGITRCNISVFADNDAGRRFWEARGWRVRQELMVMQALTEHRDTAGVR